MRYRTMVYYIQLGNAVTHKLYQRGVIKLLDSVIGVNEASKITGLSAGTIKNYCAEGKIVSKKIGQTWVIDKNILKESFKMTKTYEGSYTFNVNISEGDNKKIEQEVNRIHNMLNDPHNQKEINGLETLLYELELEVNENEDNIASIESVEYGKLNTDTGYNHFIVADVEIETVEEYEEYNVNLGNVRAFKELE